MDKQIRLKKDLSVEARGLFLTEVKYPFDTNFKGAKIEGSE